MRTLALLVLAAPLLAQGHHRKENPALLGIVAVPAPKGKAIVIAHVLDKSPAKKAGLAIGDEIVSIADSKISKPADVDAALTSSAASDKVAVVYRRGGKEATAHAKLMARGKYKGDFLKPRPRGRTGFKAPAWSAFAWVNVPEGKKPPTLKGSRGKVVVFHCFQSW